MKVKRIEHDQIHGHGQNGKRIRIVNVSVGVAGNGNITLYSVFNPRGVDKNNRHGIENEIKRAISCFTTLLVFRITHA